MEQPAKKKWIEALESNKYAKNQTYLKQTISNDLTTWSFMGVFCDIFKEKLKANWILNPFNENKYYYLLGEIYIIPKILSDKFKIKIPERDLIIKCQEYYRLLPDFTNEIEFLKKDFKWMK